MVGKGMIRALFGIIKRIEYWSSNSADNSIYVEEDASAEEIQEIISVWDTLSFNENTQAHHLNNVIGFDEWVDMEEVRRRILELFGMEYKNFRSLYPYLKTLVDIGLMETTSVGGRRKWRKIALLAQAKKEDKMPEKKPILIKKKKEN
tara:strand:- start:12662 stop:13105 length:444 start_codon:yes stop_codon:yes gene_type:complete